MNVVFDLCFYIKRPHNQPNVGCNKRIALPRQHTRTVEHTNRSRKCYTLFAFSVFVLVATYRYRLYHSTARASRQKP
ncbi:unnamed protein product [Ceratitis capitata]|uniref:(Mediterranean fruit fly) hypothetical protein n=1 Tax=Ceratitis capitata TaxID=7213 RepID=A0A811UJQ1_CERCA|nr:unnamed protein product [Ceratitis capitata]